MKRKMIASLITRSTQTSPFAPRWPPAAATTAAPPPITSVPRKANNTAVRQPLYAQELGRRQKQVLDLGLLESPSPPSVGMDRMAARTRWGRYLVEFASKASFHGLNHLAAPRRHVFERFLMGMSMLGALGGLIGISLDSWYRYQHESTMLVLDNNFRKFEIAKPSITICPINLLNQNKFPEVFKRHNVSDSPATRSFLLALANLTYGNMRDSVDASFAAVESSTWLRLLYELRADVRLVSQYADEFTWISTERGLCMMVASHLGDYSSVQYWLTNQLPAPSANMNRKTSYFNVNNYGVVGSISCKTHDFWIGLHYPDTIIEYTTPGKTVRRVTLNSLTLGIAEVGSSERVRQQLSVRQRNCKVHEDGGLRSWPLYTSSMCRLECRYEELRRSCGCVPHFARPIKGVPTCNARQLQSCIAEQAVGLIHLRAEKLKSCGCLQDCNEALYIDKESTSFALKEGSPPDAIMNLNIDFPQVKYIHEELFGLTDFLASVGGAAGLFLGASVLSFCEIVYFATLRLMWYGVDERRKERKMKRLLMAK